MYDDHDGNKSTVTELLVCSAKCKVETVRLV
jgi:hypothetical protein